ncbi:MAG: hypothetical protein AAGK14_01595 [Verrucomicrobiota bacterium]
MNRLILRSPGELEGGGLAGELEQLRAEVRRARELLDASAADLRARTETLQRRVDGLETRLNHLRTP